MLRVFEGPSVDDQLRINAHATLTGLGIDVRRARGRPPAGVASEEELWLLGRGSGEMRVIATPLAPTRRSKVPSLDLPRLWVASHITPRSARALVVAGEAFVDGHGNAHLRLPGLMVHVTGKRSGAQHKPERTPALLHEWRGPALRLVFHLLVDGELASLPVRELAELTDTAPGTVVNVFDSLERMGVLVRTGPRTRRFVPDDRVIDRWIVEYERKLWPRTLIGRFRADRTFERASCNVADRPAVWGAEAAAERLGASLRPEVRTLYVAGETKAILRRARLHPAADGDLELRTMFWHRALPAPHEDVAPVLLIVADLLATGDGRCAEAAQELRREHLARSLER